MLRSRMRRWGTIFVALVLGACRAPDATSAPTPTVVRVVDAIDEAPLPFAVVHIAGVQTPSFTDLRGEVELALEGPVALHAAAPDHQGVVRRDARPGAPIVLALWPEAPSEEAVDSYLARLEHERRLRDDPGDPALRPEARALLLGLPTTTPEGDVGVARAALEAPPETIRIWRRSIDGASASCDGRIDVIDFDEYVRGVLPHEWIASWHEQSLRTGALAIRTYAWNWIRRGGKYDCADLDDTARSQVYGEERNARATAAVDDTLGEAITVDGMLVSGEYSAENGDPTATGVGEPLCTGRELRGHGRGVCQWGSQRWADQRGQDYRWIATHYYPSSIVEAAEAPALFDAALEAAPPALTMQSGETVEVTFTLRNTGERVWMQDAVWLATESGEASGFASAGWRDDTYATGPDSLVVDEGDSSGFTFVLTAPEVATEEERRETFRLTADGTAFGPALPLHVTIVPTSGPPPAFDTDAGAARGDAGDASGGLSGSCAATPGRGRAPAIALVVLGLFLLRRRVP